jgi:AcrR family transcriptional regulator
MISIGWKQGQEATGDTRTSILDAAEALFAERGYDGVSLRDITGRAAVKLSLASYHFKTKDALFEAVVARRIEMLGGLRQAALRDVVAQGRPSVEGVLHAFAGPFLVLMLEGGPGWRQFGRLVAQLALGDRHQALTRRYLDETTRIFVAALAQALPDASADRITRAFAFAASTIVAAFAKSCRRLDGTESDSFAGDLTAMYEDLVPFVAAGVRALAALRAPA